MLFVEEIDDFGGGDHLNIYAGFGIISFILSKKHLQCSAVTSLIGRSWTSILALLLIATSLGRHEF